ncbi:non-functional pseudokinase ZED1-like isoform X2 [Herrania umbratica]|uniref:Non-functional pseudokinase ZED1-like isoform X2 n=1 Tax=Herrania umbratica TaxID=108875 RepID=A0A6J1A6R7_9ROSI|nr:non-functional pseudokinase ZED1-like isoform X2 [Herrania umbratica]
MDADSWYNLYLYLHRLQPEGKMCSSFTRRTRTKDEGPLLKNGSMLLEKLIASCNGKCNPIRTFSAEELSKATNGFNVEQEISRYVHFVLYKGFLDGREISVKRYKIGESKYLETAITDIVIGSQMSVHKNVLKLIGCCLETQNPVLVYEFGGEKTLKKCILDVHEGQFEPLTWKSRLRIAMDVASAVAYLHTALSRPIIHRGLSLISIVLDSNHVAKLSEFSLSIAIPEGKSHVEDAISGITGYMAPEVWTGSKINEKADVYSFGRLLFELLTGRNNVPEYYAAGDAIVEEFVQSYVESNRLIEIVDHKISSEGINRDELVAFAKIALSCTVENPEDRPTITDVAKQLRQLRKDSPCIP